MVTPVDHTVLCSIDSVVGKRGDQLAKWPAVRQAPPAHLHNSNGWRYSLLFVDQWCQYWSARFVDEDAWQALMQCSISKYLSERHLVAYRHNGFHFSRNL